MFCDGKFVFCGLVGNVIWPLIEARYQKQWASIRETDKALGLFSDKFLSFMQIWKFLFLSALSSHNRV